MQSRHGSDIGGYPKLGVLRPLSPGYGQVGKSVTSIELRDLMRPGRCLIVYHHHSGILTTKPGLIDDKIGIIGLEATWDCEMIIGGFEPSGFYGGHVDRHAVVSGLPNG